MKVEELIDIGLTKNQAEIYLELNNKSKAREMLGKAEEFYPDYKKTGDLLKKCD